MLKNQNNLVFGGDLYILFIRSLFFFFYNKDTDKLSMQLLRKAINDEARPFRDISRRRNKDPSE